MIGNETVLKVCELVFRDDFELFLNDMAVLGQSEERLDAKRPWRRPLQHSHNKGED